MSLWLLILGLVKTVAVNASSRGMFTNLFPLIERLSLMALSLRVLMFYEALDLLLEHQEEKLDEFNFRTVTVYRLYNAQFDPLANLFTVFRIGAIHRGTYRVFLLLLHGVARLGCPIMLTSCTAFPRDIIIIFDAITWFKRSSSFKA